VSVVCNAATIFPALLAIISLYDSVVAVAGAVWANTNVTDNNIINNVSAISIMYKLPVRFILAY
jgi:hypothetical protein